MNFLVDINPNMKPIEYKMVLCKLNEEQLMTITNISNFEYKGEFISIDELSFDIPLYRMESDGTQIKNERYDAIKGDMLILLNGMKYFYIHYAKEKVDSDGATYKEVQAYSREFELSQKKLVGYSGVSRKIYDYTNFKDENGLEIGFFNRIEAMCSWRVGYINANILAKFRALDFPNSNLLQVFQEIQQTFGCVFQYDTINKVIDIYEIDQLGTNRGLHISDKNFLQSLEKTIKSDEIKTRLFLYGRDNISTQKLSITGKPYIENYDFYKTTEYMSQDLIDALDNYDAYLLTKQGLFDGYLTQLNTKNAELGTRNDELVALQTELKVIQSNLDVAISSGQPTDTFKTQETNKLAEISTKLSQILALQGEIEVIKGNINSIAVDTDMTKHFTEAQARELDSFIREDTFMDSNYTEDNLDELLAEGKKILNRISQPAIQFNVSVIDFLSVVECQHEWSKFVLGDKVNLFHKDLNFDYEVRLVGYTHNPDSNSLDLKFSNTNTIDDANLYLRDLLTDLKTTSTSVDFSRYKWDKGEQANSMISNYISSNLDLEKQKIMGASSQKPLVDERGIWLVKDVDGIIDNEQTRLVNNAIVMTKDNWNTSDIAISPNSGINASLINGKIGNLATLNAEQINVGGGDNPPNLNDELTRIQQETQDKINLVNGEISDVDGKINGLENFSNAAFKDGILDMAEKESLSVHIQQLNNEKSDVDAKYTSIYADVNLIETPKSSLLTAKNNYNTSHGSLLTTINNTISDSKVTESEKTLINNAFIDYRAKLSALSTAFENAIRAIESKKAEVIANNLIVDFNTNTLVPAISGVQTQIDGKIEFWNQETDPSTAWNTADLKLKHTGDMWYNTTTKELKHYSGSAWVLIEDKKAYEALGVANTKRTIFTSTPTPPYLVGDLWKVTGIAGIDFRVCMTANTIGYLASDWVDVNNSKTYVDAQKAELNTAITGLGTTITTAFSDGVITNIEAQSLKLTRNTLIREANDVRAIAVGLSLSVSTLDSSITALNTEVNKYVDKATYPISVTATARTNLNSAFTTVEGRIVALYNSIESKKVTDLSGTLTGLIGGLQTQVDGKIETFAQTDDPSVAWTTTTLKSTHSGDIWYHTTNKTTKRWSGTAWVALEDATAINASALASSKNKIYTVQPTTPYIVGDLWINNQEIYRCTTALSTGSYNASHWVKAVKYTDDTTAIANLASAKAYAETKATDAKTSAEAYAKTKAEAERVIAVAHADGIVSAEEQARINDANTKLTTAKTYAETKASEAETASKSYAEAQRVVATNYADGLATNLQTQIDGKIDTWFYAVNPTLSNAPYNTWTSIALRDAHIDDLYYNTANGYVFKFTKTGTVYSWERIKDADIVTAMTSASTAQATADGKMTVFTSQPAPPYHLGDLWRVSASATDLKICTTARASGLYTAGDWSDATNVSGALSGLQGSINDFSSDLKLTLAEANGLKTSLESVTSESLELVSTATTLGITTEKTNYSTSLTTLANYLNTNWLGKTYPLTITIAQRTNVTNYFKDLENKKSILITKIADARAIKEVNDNAIKKGTLYNGVKIDAENGFVATRDDNKAKTTVNATEGIKIQGNIGGVWQDNFYVDTNGYIRAKNIIIDGLDSGAKVFNAQPTTPYKLNDLWKVSGVAGVDFRICTRARASGAYVASDWTNVTDSKKYTDLIKNLTSGTSIAGGITTIDRNRVRVTHASGQYSEMRADGFIRAWANGESAYLNDIYVFTGLASDNDRDGPNPLTIPLPDRFKNRTDLVAVLVPKDWCASRLVYVFNDNTVSYALDYIDLWTSVSITTGSNPRANVTAYLEIRLENEEDSKYRVRFRDVGFDLIIFGY